MPRARTFVVLFVYLGHIMLAGRTVYFALKQATEESGNVWIQRGTIYNSFLLSKHSWYEIVVSTVSVSFRSYSIRQIFSIMDNDKDKSVQQSSDSIFFYCFILIPLFFYITFKFVEIITQILVMNPYLIDNLWSVSLF